MPQRGHALRERDLPPASMRRGHGFRHRVEGSSNPEYPTGIARKRNLLLALIRLDCTALQHPDRSIRRIYSMFGYDRRLTPDSSHRRYLPARRCFVDLDTCIGSVETRAGTVCSDMLRRAVCTTCHRFGHPGGGNTSCRVPPIDQHPTPSGAHPTTKLCRAQLAQANLR